MKFHSIKHETIKRARKLQIVLTSHSRIFHTLFNANMVKICYLDFADKPFAVVMRTIDWKLVEDVHVCFELEFIIIMGSGSSPPSLRHYIYFQDSFCKWSSKY